VWEKLSFPIFSQGEKCGMRKGARRMAYNIPEAPPWFSEKLTRYALEAGCLLSDKQVELLKLHAEWVFFWNRVTNLTAAKNWEELIHRHYLDAIIPACKWLPQRGRVFDIGSGAGFPGIPIKILSPEMDVTLCELRRRKASFLRSFIAHAGLNNIRVTQMKWQEAAKQDTEKFDLVTVRALRLENKEILDLARDGLTERGAVALWSTPSAIEKSDLVKCLAQKGITTDIFSYSLPDGVERTLMMVKK
jgi:16S rRNA (guanine527-N7)-methyltransferase